MGNDAALACLSSKARLVTEFFKQLFAQVTNPPIDPIREDVVMSLACPVGPETNLLAVGPEASRRLVVEHPLLTLGQLEFIKKGRPHGWRCTELDITYPIASGAKGLLQALDAVCEQAAKVVQDGSSLLVLTDTAASRERVALPALCVVGAVHHHLITRQLRGKVKI
jgi:glutamate synthase (NADPH/NADH)